MKAISVADLSHLPKRKARRLRELFDIENWPDPIDDGLEHRPGHAELLEQDGFWEYAPFDGEAEFVDPVDRGGDS